MSSVKKDTQKPPVAIELKPGAAPASPHVLNLKQPRPTPRKAHEPLVSLEERIAAFDERLKEVPDLLRARGENFTRLLGSQRETWQHTFSSFLNAAGKLGAQLQRRTDQAVTLARKTAKRNPVPLRFPSLLKNQLSVFILLLLIITLPLQGIVLYRTIKGIEHSLTSNWTGGRIHLNGFLNAIQDQDFESAQRELTVGLKHISALRATLEGFGPLRYFLPERLRFGYAALGLTEIAGLSSTHVLEELSALIRGEGNFASFLKTTEIEVSSLTKKLRLMQEDNWGDYFQPLYEKLTATADMLTIFTDFAGLQETKRLLVLFENPRELRATGGFAGSLALLTIRDGAIVRTEIPEGGSYDVQGQLTLRRVSPQPLHLINPRFELQDANWWPDFPTSAKKMSEIYEATGGSTIDGVIAATAYVGEELLKLTGPIPMNSPERQAAGLPAELRAENFIDTLQAAIEQDRANNRRTPKKIITTLFPAFTEEIAKLAKREPRALASTLLSLLEQQDLQLWSRNETTQAAIRRLDVGGKLTDPTGDYLAVITSNVGGGKTDGVVNEKISHEVLLRADGTAQATLTISRTHQGARGDQRTGLRNISYLRIYVPAGSRFISAAGFNPPPAHRFETPDAALEPDPEVRSEEAQMHTDPQSATQLWHENKRMVFGNWLLVDPGQTATGTITYELPLKLTTPTIPYTLTIDPQAGKRATLVSRVILDDTLRLITGEGDGNWESAQWNYAGPLSRTIVASGMLLRL